MVVVLVVLDDKVTAAVEVVLEVKIVTGEETDSVVVIEVEVTAVVLASAKVLLLLLVVDAV